MSRTDRHRPREVQLADPLERNWYWFYRGLRWGWVKEPVHRTCGDRWCGMHYWRIEENRRRRHGDQRRGRDAVKGVQWE